MADMYQDERLRRRWDMLTTIAESRLSALRESGDEIVDMRVDPYMTTYGVLHARIAAAAAVMNNARLGDVRLSQEFAAHLEMHHRSELLIMQKEIAAKVADRIRGDSTWLGTGMRLSVASRNNISLMGKHHRAEMTLSSEVPHIILDPSEPVRVEARHIEHAEHLLRSFLQRHGDPEWATRAIVFGRHDPESGRRGYGWRDDCVPVAPYPVPVTLDVIRPWSHGMQGHVSISLPRRLIMDMNGPIDEEDEIRTFNLSAFDLVHDVPTALKQGLIHAGSAVCETLRYRAEARREAGETMAAVRHDITASNGATTIGSCQVRHERRHIQTTLILRGYCPSTFRRKEYEIQTYELTLDAQLKSLYLKIKKQIEADHTIHRKVGFMPIPDDADVDLGLYRVDKPLLRLLSRADAATLLRHAVLHDGNLPEGSDALLGVPVRIHIDRARIKGTFDLGPGAEWRGGRIKLHRTVLPAAIRNALVGMTASSLVAHPLICEDMTVSSFQEMVSNGETDTYVRFDGSTVSAKETTA